MGDVIIVYGDVDYDGFYRGELAGRRGLVPSNFLRPASAADAAPRPRHPRGPLTGPLPPTAMSDEALMTRGPALSEAPYGQPPVASPTPSGTLPQQRRPGDVAQSTSMTGPPPAHPLPAIESRDLSMASSSAYVGIPEFADDRLHHSGQTFRR